MRTNEDIISLKNISLSLSGPDKKLTHILHDISVQVQQGSAVSIIGASGSGKTSLMMLIAGVEKPTAGQIIIAGQDITDFNEDQLAHFRRQNISVVFQNFHLIPTMTAYENVEIALELAGCDDSESRAKASLQSVGLDQRMDHYPDQLSGGEQQRVALARAFATKPKLLLADEPTGNLDSENGKQVTQLLFKLMEEHNTTLVLITHDMNLAAMTSRQLHIQDGRLQDGN